ncbi:MAG: hypothetical protein M0T86_02600 [Betaproteobacteria bacterium]|nr:hypothetical protein [Betaproteobacteria bacterium]
MSAILVTMQFRLYEHKPRTVWLELNQQLDAWSSRQPGFRFRSLSETADGKWILIICWGNAEAAHAAEERFREDMEDAVIPFIDPDSYCSHRSRAHSMLQAQG